MWGVYYVTDLYNFLFALPALFWILIFPDPVPGGGGARSK